MAECHPVGVPVGDGGQAARRDGHPRRPAVHPDQRGGRPARAERAGGDIVFLGALINYVLSGGKYFREYVTAYTNAADDPDRGLRRRRGPGRGCSPATTRRYDPPGVTTTGRDRGGRPASGTRALAEPLSIRAASSRCSSGTSPGTPPRWWSRPAACRRTFRRIASADVELSGRERTTAFVYSVGWTQHTTGVQYIRTAAILQLLLGNMGRPGGGILALRGHASIQGSTDIPTLFDLLPGYLPMPRAGDVRTWRPTWRQIPDTGLLGQQARLPGQPAQGVVGRRRDGGERLLLRLPAAADRRPQHLPTVTDRSRARCRATSCSARTRPSARPTPDAAAGMANLDWLVVRDLVMIESATFWQDGPGDRDRRDAHRGHRTEVFFLPAAAHTEKDGTFTNTQRMLQWHHKAVEPPGDARSDLWFTYHLGRRIRARLAGSTDEMDRPVLDLTWDYPVQRPLAEPVRRGGARRGQRPGRRRPAAVRVRQLKDDGSTACGCWIYSARTPAGSTRPPGASPAPSRAGSRRVGLGLAGQPADPVQPGLGRPGRQAVERAQGLRLVGRGGGQVDRARRAGLRADPAAVLPAARARPGSAAISGIDPFIMQNGRQGVAVRPGRLVDGPLPAHYEPQESPFSNPLYSQQRNPAGRSSGTRRTRCQPSGSEPGLGCTPTWRPPTG
jgi:formate dehydrogenase major subunit